ncbi:hypothetical protein GCM10009416_14470 [Craurococcus roseus]|uniref:Uncharacterized protein n=1 Tax=Craurococcus roseus TaxID=77585 RepID=A0ABP3PW00_9PROT
MRASRGEDRPAVAGTDPDALLRMRLAIADAAFVAEGVTLGLLLRWAGRAAPPFDGLPPPVLRRRALDDGARLGRPPTACGRQGRHRRRSVDAFPGGAQGEPSRSPPGSTASWPGGATNGGAAGCSGVRMGHSHAR